MRYFRITLFALTAAATSFRFALSLDERLARILVLAWVAGWLFTLPVIITWLIQEHLTERPCTPRNVLLTVSCTLISWPIVHVGLLVQACPPFRRWLRRQFLDCPKKHETSRINDP
jgi:hypothetical protein